MTETNKDFDNVEINVKKVLIETYLYEGLMSAHTTEILFSCHAGKMEILVN